MLVESAADLEAAQLISDSQALAVAIAMREKEEAAARGYIRQQQVAAVAAEEAGAAEQQAVQEVIRWVGLQVVLSWG
jgi:hypothetical protein